MKHIAVDLGAESGRVMLGTLTQGRLALEELHRFPSTRSFVAGHWRWDVLGILEAIREGIAKAPADAVSISCDSWGVDYALLRDGHPYLTPPFMYRDGRTDAIYDKAVADDATAKVVFDESGIQFLPFNTLWQLLSDDPALHEIADGLLNIGDYFNHLLGGRAVAERSLASTSQCYDPRTHQWSEALIKHFNLRRELFPEIVPSGTVIGEADGRKIIATCSHDTGAAVAAVPLMDESCCYLSSGTWSLLGAELPQPVISDRARALNFTNEVGYGPDGKACIRFLKNLSGLFILQECRKGWSLSYADLARQAEAAQPLRTLIRPDAPQFGRLGDMPKEIADYCRNTNQPVPESPGQFARCIYESLAMLYGVTLASLEELTGRSFKTIHIVGGGSQAMLLNQLASDLTGRTVIAGPVEATAGGNLLIQAAAMGEIKPSEIRRIVRNSFELHTFEPRGGVDADALQRFKQLPTE